jgi:hypothetical protein
MFGPAAATLDGPPNLVEAGPLYAGECVDRIHDIRSAADLVRELAPDSDWQSLGSLAPEAP